MASRKKLWQTATTASRHWASHGEPIRAHGGVEKETARLLGGTPGVLGVRREDKNKWERRVPLAPRHVRELVNQGLKVVVQPSTRRVFDDEEYRKAGAEVNEDLSECAAICAVKEVPTECLLPGRTWLFFSHTIKAQPSGMALLDEILKRKVRLVDYECITEGGKKGANRLVAFGSFAGYAGAIDFLRGLGERFLALGFNTPLLHIGSAFMYPDLSEAKRSVALAGEAIRKHGLPAALCPFTAVFTGRGKVTSGALEILKLLPHEMVDPSELPAICAAGSRGKLNRHTLYLAVAGAEHMVRRKDQGPFNKAEYYQSPTLYEPVFQDTVLPFSTVVLNGMYWDARFPRLFTNHDIHRHVVSGHDKLLGICDITCDADGSVPTRQFSSIEQPFYVFNALTEETSSCLDGPGVLFHAVDHLPSELPREASEHFGDCLLPFLPALANEKAPEGPASADDLAGSESLPLPIRGAIVAEGGVLARDYRYILDLRDVKRRLVAAESSEASPSPGTGTLGPHGMPRVPASFMLEFTGHLFDTQFVNRFLDLAEEHQSLVKVISLDIGVTSNGESVMTAAVSAPDHATITAILLQLKQEAAQAHIAIRQAQLAPNAAGESSVAAPSRAAERRVLVLGAGFVAGPLVQHLLQRRENKLTVATLRHSEVKALMASVERAAGKAFGALSQQIQSVELDLGAVAASERAAGLLDELLSKADLVVSLVPAALHASIARLAVKHRVPVVTASYVSPEMQALDEDAKAKGVLLLNEVGLDPGIDHLSAMQLIDSVRDVPGVRLLRFSSVCGGLPAPEVAGSNPLGYKFSWSPRGVLLAAQNSAKFKQDGELVEIEGTQLLAHSRPFTLNNAFALDVIPNRDSTLYAELYGLEEIPTFFRGTLRYKGFSERVLGLAQLGLLQPLPCPQLLETVELPRWKWFACVLGEKGLDDAIAVKGAVRRRLTERSHPSAEAAVALLEWLGLFKDEPLPAAVPEQSKACPLDVTSALMLERQEMTLAPAERDLVVMNHELDVLHGDGRLHRHTVTLLKYGEPTGPTAMAWTVGVTTAICAQLVLDGPAKFGTGVQRPLRAAWYKPVLEELRQRGLYLEERVEVLEVRNQP